MCASVRAIIGYGRDRRGIGRRAPNHCTTPSLGAANRNSNGAHTTLARARVVPVGVNNATSRAGWDQEEDPVLHRECGIGKQVLPAQNGGPSCEGCIVLVPVQLAVGGVCAHCEQVAANCVLELSEGRGRQKIAREIVCPKAPHWWIIGRRSTCGDILDHRDVKAMHWRAGHYYVDEKQSTDGKCAVYVRRMVQRCARNQGYYAACHVCTVPRMYRAVCTTTSVCGPVWEYARPSGAIDHNRADSYVKLRRAQRYRRRRYKGSWHHPKREACKNYCSALE